MRLLGILRTQRIWKAVIIWSAVLCFQSISLPIAAAQTYTVLYTYPGTDNNTSGITWPSLMSQGPDGNLYSTIETNGADNAGSVYQLTTSGNYSLLYSFCEEGGHCTSTGANPLGGVNLGVDGNLWGTTLNGGKDGAGTVFKISPEGAFSTVYNFTNGTDDSAPTYPVLQGQDGNMYGVSGAQYNTQYGSFFKLTAKGVITAHPFDFTNGATPNLPVQGTDLNFYGSTQGGGGGTCRCGVIYKATAAGKITVLHTFTGAPSDGNRPIGVLVQGSDGDFYGTTYGGGANNLGTVFKISSAGVYKVLYSFGSVTGDGTLPIAALTAAGNGTFYGVTSSGGSKNGGSIYEITSTGKETVLYNFCVVSCYDGLAPTTPMVLHTNGKLYGNTAGNSLGGSVFYSFDVGLKPFSRLEIWEGKVGTQIAIFGQGFTATKSVKFNGAAAAFTVVSDTYLTATVPAAAKTGSVSIVTPGGTLVSSQPFKVLPTIQSIAPASGPVGTSVKVTGTGFTGATKVTVGGVTATFQVNTASQITVTVPAGAKTGKIVVTTPGGTATSSATFTVTT